MIIAVYSTIFVMSIVLSYKKFGSVLNIVSLFTAIWSVFGSMSSFGLYDLRVPMMRVHLYAWMFVVVVDIVLLLACKRNNSNAITKCNENDVFSSGNYSTYAPLIQILALLLYIPTMSNSMQAFLTGGFEAIRGAYFSYKYGGSDLLLVLYRIMPTGLINGLIAYYVYKAFATKKLKYFIYALSNALLAMIISGGRYALIGVIFATIILLPMQKRTHKKTKIKTRKFKRKLKIGIIIVALVMFYVTTLRGQDIATSIVSYFAGSFSFLDYIFTYPNQFDLYDKLHGYMTFGAITEPIVLVLKFLGITKAKTPAYLFNINCQPFYNIGTGETPMYFNNNTTVIYYFLRDFGVFGIFVGGIFLALIIAYSYNRFLKGKFFYTLVYIYMATALFNSVMTYQFFGSMPIFSIFAIYMCTRPSKIRIVLRNQNMR